MTLLPLSFPSDGFRRQCLRVGSGGSALNSDLGLVVMTPKCRFSDFSDVAAQIYSVGVGGRT